MSGSGAPLAIDLQAIDLQAIDLQAIDLQEQLTRIERMNAETRKFVEESMTFSAETRKLTRDATIAPYTAIFTAFTAGAAVVGAVVTAVRLLGA